MQKTACLLLLFVLGATARADATSHLKAAEELATIAAGPESVRTGFDTSLEPMFANLARQGAPAEMITEYRQALKDWFDTEIKWAELLPLLAKLYADEYTEEELNAILAFVKTPAGQKMIQRTPAVMQKATQLGEDYAKTKQASLVARMQEINARYQPAAAPKP